MIITTTEGKTWKVEKDGPDVKVILDDRERTVTTHLKVEEVAVLVTALQQVAKTVIK